MTVVQDKIFTKCVKCLKNMDDAQLGWYLKRYLTDSIHNNWDGWPAGDIVGAKSLVIDLDRNIMLGLLKE